MENVNKDKYEGIFIEKLPSSIRGLINDLTRTLTGSLVHMDDLLCRLENDSEEFQNARQANEQLGRAIEFFIELRSEYLIWEELSYANHNKIKPYNVTIEDKLLHIFNNLLEVVLGHCDMMRHDYADGGRSCQHMDYICNNIKNTQNLFNKTICLPELSTSITKSNLSLGTPKPSKTKSFKNVKNYKKIMLIEDNQDITNIITSFLYMNKYSVVACSTGNKALDIFNNCKDKFIIYIVDIGLPDIEGPNIVKKFLSKKKDINVLFISGYNEAKLKSNYTMINQNQILTKPFRLPDLLNKIRSIELN